jgi:membrane protein
MVRKRIKNIWEVIAETFVSFDEDNVFKLSAALAYYTIFSIAPMLMIIIALVGFVYGKEAIQGEIYMQINELVGNSAALQIQEIIKNISSSRETTFATVVGIITLAFGATGVFTEIQESINMIWGVKAKPKRGFVKLIFNRVLSFSMVVGMGFLLIVSLVVNALMTSFGKALATYFPELTVYVLYGINFIFTFVVITILFGVIFKVLPDAVIRWRDVGVGAIATAVLFLLGKLGISFYLGQSDLGTTYGAAGSLIIILLWVYYSSVILYIGAEFTHVYATKYGRKIMPTEYAVLVESIEIERTVDSDDIKIIHPKSEEMNKI